VLNARLTDVSKSRISRHLVVPGDGYEGPVVVKTDLNYGGAREASLERRQHRAEAGRARRALARWVRHPRIRTWAGVRARMRSDGYPIYPTPADVPDAVWTDPALVVEQFLPEHEDGDWYLRKLWCFGDRVVHWRSRGRSPIVKAEAIVEREVVDDPPDLEPWRRTLGLEYGKVDYTCPEPGRAAVLDVNPTPGCGHAVLARLRVPLVGVLEQGLDALLRP
jgi:hypothetical protein